MSNKRCTHFPNIWEPGAKRSKFCTENSQILSATIQNVFVTVTLVLRICAPLVLKFCLGGGGGVSFLNIEDPNYTIVL